MLILPGLLHQERWFTNTAFYDNCLLATSESGYTNDKLSFKWLQHFVQQTTASRVEAWRMLLLDGYASHCTYKFIQYYDNKKIVPFCFLLHTTWSSH